MELDMKDLGKRIAQRRKKIGIKQNKLAEMLDISNNHMSGIENGKEKPSLALFVKICDSLKVTPDYLILGNMHSGNVPKDIYDLLQLCSSETCDLIRVIAQHTIACAEKMGIVTKLIISDIINPKITNQG